MPPDVLRDRLANAPVRPTANAAMTVIDKLQDFDPEVQLLGITAVFLLLARKVGIRPADLFTFADNLMHDADAKRPEFRGVAAYIENELL